MTALKRSLAQAEAMPEHSLMDWKKVGETYRAARKRLKLNQTEMAARAGIAQTTLSDVERGKTTTTTTLDAVSQAAGLELQVTLHPIGEAPPALTPEMIEAAQIIGDLSDDDRRMFLELMRVWPNLPEDLRIGNRAQWRYLVKLHGEVSDTSRSIV